MSLLNSVRTCWYEDDDNAQSDNIECGSDGIEVGDPFGRHTADASVDEHDQGRKEKDLIILRNVCWHTDGSTS